MERKSSSQETTPRLVVLPLEGVVNRYPEQWAKWLPAAWPEALFVPGEPLTDRVETGAWLDVFSTWHYKGTQLARVARMMRDGEIRDGDILLLMDAWFPLEGLFYMIEAAGMSIRVAGVLHAGAYDPHDFLSRRGMRWAQGFEKAVFRRLDLVVVFSEFHKRLLKEEVGVNPARVIVCDFPYVLSDLDWYHNGNTRKHDVCFPHRLDPEKCPETVELMVSAGLSVCVTSGMSRDEYYQALASSRYVFSWAWQETYGISIMEGQYLGAHPVLPRRLSYEELYPRECLFPSIRSAINHMAECKPTSLQGPHMKWKDSCRRLATRVMGAFGAWEVSVE